LDGLLPFLVLRFGKNLRLFHRYHGKVNMILDSLVRHLAARLLTINKCKIVILKEGRNRPTCLFWMQIKTTKWPGRKFEKKCKPQFGHMLFFH
jgi:hypothetical protein